MGKSVIKYVISGSLVKKNVLAALDYFEAASKIDSAKESTTFILIEKETGRLCFLNHPNKKSPVTDPVNEFIAASFSFSYAHVYKQDDIQPFKVELPTFYRCQLAKEAKNILDQSLIHLNRIACQVGGQIKDKRSVTRFFEEMSHVEIGVTRFLQDDRELFKSCYVDADAALAEKILDSQVQGAFLISKCLYDQEFAAVNSQDGKPLLSYTLHYVSSNPAHPKERKLEHRMILKVEEGWILYADRVNLERVKIYSHLADLLKAVELTHPVVRLAS